MDNNAEKNEVSLLKKQIKELERKLSNAIENNESTEMFSDNMEACFVDFINKAEKKLVNFLRRVTDMREYVNEGESNKDLKSNDPLKYFLSDTEIYCTEILLLLQKTRLAYNHNFCKDDYEKDFQND